MKEKTKALRGQDTRRDSKRRLRLGKKRKDVDAGDRL